MSLDLARKLHRLPRPKALVVGDLIQDCDLHGTMARYAAECPGCPVFAADHEERRSGGAGAVRAMVEGLGADAVLVRGPRVSRKFRYFVDGRQVFRADGDAAGPLTPGEEAAVARDVTLAVCDSDIVLVADYGKGVCTERVLNAAIGGAKAKGIPCIVDPARGRPWSDYAGATAIKANSLEYGEQLDRNEARDFPYMIVTYGKTGLQLFDFVNADGGDFPVRLRNVADVVGAGDMVLAALGVGIAGGLGWPDACQVANAAAGLKVERRGAVPVSRAEVVADLLHGHKIIPAELLLAVAGAARAAGRKIAFTNGCFDVLHAGHVQCLTEAKAQADVLIVGVNDDDSVRALKGPGRPVNPLAGRLEVLAGLSCVDWVVSFDGPTPADLVEIVRPDVLAKGADYAGREIAGAEHTGRVHLCALRPGCSTTETLRRLEVASC